MGFGRQTDAGERLAGIIDHARFHGGAADVQADKKGPAMIFSEEVALA